MQLIGKGLFCLLLGFLPLTNAAANPSLEKLIDRVGSTCLNANKAEELSPLLAELESYRNPASNILQDSKPWLRQELEGAIYLATHWKDYLTANTAGNKTTAYNTLLELLGNTSWLSLMTRSAVMERYYKCYTFRNAELPAGKIEDISKVIKIINDLQKQLDSTEAYRELVLSLQEIEKTWLGVANKEWSEIRQICFGTRDFPVFQKVAEPIVYVYRQYLWAFAVAGFLDLPEQYQLPPQDGETADALLGRIITKAREAKDLRALWRCLAYRDFLQWEIWYPRIKVNHYEPTPFNLPRAEQPNQPGLSEFIFYGNDWEKTELAALDLCLQADKMEREGLISDAIILYRSVLRCPIDTTPVEVAINRLQEITKSHPEESQIASQMPLNLKRIKGHSNPPPLKILMNEVWKKY